MRAPTRKKVFNIRGEAKQTKSGLERQDILLAAEVGESVTLVREPDNQFDTNAVLVVFANHDIGYLSKEDAAVVAPALDNGLPHKAQLHQITGGVGDAKHYGARVSIAWFEQSLPAPLARDVAQEQERERRAEQKLDQDSTTCCLGVAALVLLGTTTAALSAISLA